VILVTPELVLASAPVIAAIAALVWACRRHPKNSRRK
jgi:hypothetical protein